MNDYKVNSYITTTRSILDILSSSINTSACIPKDKESFLNKHDRSAICIPDKWNRNSKYHQVSDEYSESPNLLTIIRRLEFVYLIFPCPQAFSDTSLVTPQGWAQRVFVE